MESLHKKEDKLHSFPLTDGFSYISLKVLLPLNLSYCLSFGIGKHTQKKLHTQFRLLTKRGPYDLIIVKFALENSENNEQITTRNGYNNQPGMCIICAYKCMHVYIARLLLLGDGFV